MTTVAEALRQARAQGLDRADAMALLGALLARSRTWLLTHDDAPLDDAQQARWQDWLARRQDEVPVAYLTGQHEFHGLMLAVTPDVLDPRPDTETLVDWALEHLPPQGSAVDLGTGSGAIALALKSQRPEALVGAVDASAEALAVARANAERLQLPVHFVQGHWLSGVRGPFDLIVSNPPYIAEDDPHLDQLGHEPRMALTSGVDGLDALRTIIAQAPAHLQPGGWLLLEHGWQQAEAVRDLLTQTGFVQVQSRRDLAGIERCSGGQWPGG